MYHYVRFTVVVGTERSILCMHTTNPSLKKIKSDELLIYSSRTISCTSLTRQLSLSTDSAVPLDSLGPGPH